MKIRTDFVTNSSSSSFVVEISIKATNGEEYITKVNPDDGGGNGDANIMCTAKDVLESNSIASLAKLLEKKIEINEPEGASDYFKEKVSEFFKEISEKFTSIDEIDTITFRRIWSAWGEASSCFGWNLECYAEELPDLAAKVCELEGDEKEKAKDDLQKYLSNYSGSIDGEWGGCFPSGFMGANGKGAIVWTGIANSIEDFAQKVVSQNLPNDDYAVETTTINIKSKNVTQTAEYILVGSSFDKDEEYWDEEDLWEYFNDL